MGCLLPGNRLLRRATQSFWAVTPAGLLEAANADALLLALWPHNAPLMPPALAVEALTLAPA